MRPSRSVDTGANVGLVGDEPGGRVHGRGGVDRCDVRVVENVVRFDEELRLQLFPQREEASGVADIELVNVGRSGGVAAYEQRARDGEAVSVQHRRVRDDRLLVARGDVAEHRELVAVEEIVPHSIVEFYDRRPYGAQSERIGPVDRTVAAVAVAVGRIGDEHRALVVGVGFGRIVDGMRPRVRSIDEQATGSEAVLIVHDQRVVRTVIADVLERDVVVQGVGSRGGASRSVNGTAVGEVADGVDEVYVAEVLEIAAAGAGITYRKSVVRSITAW